MSQEQLEQGLTTNELLNSTTDEQLPSYGSRSKSRLSKREMQVLIQIKEGLRNPEIAADLGLSTKTVENHVRSILQKLGAKNRTEAVVIALKNSLIEI
ncbi:MAG: response regulator transcription factor [Candidatus Melainabacteria bacterium]|nr:response regulator transcription factor [Candidatus Melainabacteria bacterium]